MKPENDAGAGACKRVATHLPALVDGALAPLAEARDRGHLEACAPCRSALEHHERLLVALRAAARAERERVETRVDVAHVMAAVLARVGMPARAPVPPRRSGTPWRRAAGLAAAAAAVLVLAVLESRSGLVTAGSPGRLAALERVFEQLPSWSDVVRGLGHLSRPLS